MTPVAIGDTQGTLQARKTCKTVYNRPETLLWVYIGKPQFKIMFKSQTGYWQKVWFETSNAPLFPLRPPKLHITLVRTKDPISDRIQDMKIRWHWNHHRASHNTNNEMWKTNAGSYLWAILLWHLIKLIPLAGYFATYPDKGIDSETKWY